MLVNSLELLSEATRLDHAVPCITLSGYEDAKATIKAAEYLQKPVILAAGQHLIASEGISETARMLTKMAIEADVPVCLHLNSGFIRDQVICAIQSGFCSVAFDGSSLPLEDNIRVLREIAEMAHTENVAVEGAIASDDVFAAEALVRDTGIDSLAVLAGVSEDSLSNIAKRIAIPLVSHQWAEASRHVSVSHIAKFDLGSVLSETFVETFEKEKSEARSELDRQAVLRKTTPVIQEFSCKLLRQFYRPVIQTVEPGKPIWGYPVRD